MKYLTHPMQDWLGQDWFGAERSPTWVPDVDVLENDQDYILVAELAGLNKEDVKVQIDGDQVTLKGERKQEKTDKAHRIERYYGSFSRSFQLPHHIDADNVRAEYKDGVLSVKIGKQPENSAKEIEVQVS